MSFPCMKNTNRYLPSKRLRIAQNRACPRGSSKRSCSALEASRLDPWKMLRAGGLVLFVMFSGALSNVSAQQIARSSSNNMELPDAPGTGYPLQTSSQSSPIPQPSASISGTVLDPNGTGIPGARVSFSGQNGTGQRVVLADDQGRFTFSDLPSGTFRITIAAAGFKTFTSDQIALAPGEKRELPAIALPVAGTSEDVEVVATQAEVAQAQVNAAEKQRVLGIVPNFYSSYIWNAAPMTPKLKFGLALRSVTDPVEFMTAGALAGVEQFHNTFPGYGSGSEGYLKRYGAAYADIVVARMIGSAVLPSLFHQDPRYFYKGSGSITSRAFYAIKQSVICRGDNGRSEPNYSRVLGSFAAAGISNLYRAPEDRSASLTFRNGFIVIGSNAAGNLVREFLLRKITSKVPDYEQGKP
jgi:Carboxypeptidase regulatory-like domain